jgi:hypothetical protein
MTNRKFAVLALVLVVPISGRYLYMWYHGRVVHAAQVAVESMTSTAARPPFTLIYSENGEESGRKWKSRVILAQNSREDQYLESHRFKQVSDQSPSFIEKVVRNIHGGPERVVYWSADREILLKPVLAAFGLRPERKSIRHPVSQFGCIAGPADRVERSERVSGDGWSVLASVVRHTDPDAVRESWRVVAPDLGCLEIKEIRSYGLSENSLGRVEMAPLSLTLGEPDVRLLSEFESAYNQAQLVPPVGKDYVAEINAAMKAWKSDEDAVKKLPQQ